MSGLRKRKFRTDGVLMEAQQQDQEVSEQSREEDQERSFDNPVPLGMDLARLYEEHKKDLAGVSGPYIPRTTREEDEVMFTRMGNLSKRDRKSPERNSDLMPEKPIIEEKLPEGVDDGTTLTP